MSNANKGSRIPAGIDNGMVDHDNPWPGPEPFTENLSSFFFGREEDAKELFLLVKRESLTVLYGRSGLGKTSLLQAGLFPLLRQSDLFPLDLRIVHGSNAADPIQQICNGISKAVEARELDAPGFDPQETLWEYFHRRNLEFWNDRNRLVTPVLVFDQFEEIFTLGAAAEQRARTERLIQELVDLVETPMPDSVKAAIAKEVEDVKDKRIDKPVLSGRYEPGKPRCKVLITLREDFLPHMEGRLKREMPSLMHNRRLEQMTGAQALQVIEKAGGHLLEDYVGTKIVRFVASPADGENGDARPLEDLSVEPALLSIFSRELNNKRIAAKLPRISVDLLQGNRREILSGFYDRCVKGLPPETSIFIEDRLLTESGFRQSEPIKDVLASGRISRETMDLLIKRRLLHVEDRLGAPRLELTHDVLIEPVQASKNKRRARQKELSELEAARARETEIQQRLKDSHRRTAWYVFIAIILVGLFICVPLSIVAVSQRNSARIEMINAKQQRLNAESNFKGAQAEIVNGRVFQGDTLLAAGRRQEALDCYQTAWKSVRQYQLDPYTAQVGLWESDQPMVLRSRRAHENAVSCIACTPDGKTVLTGGWDNYLSFWDADSGKCLASLKEHEKAIESVAVSSDGHFAVTGSHDSTIKVWELTAGEQPQVKFTLRGHSGIVSAVAISSDGQYLLSGDSDGNIFLWDFTTAKMINKFDKGEYTTMVSFIPMGDEAIAVDTNGSVKILDVKKLLVTRSFQTNVTVMRGAVSPNGQQLLATCGDSSVRLWELQHGKELQQLHGHSSTPFGVAFSSDGRCGLSSSRGQIILWDLIDGRDLQTLHGHTSDIYGVTFANKDGASFVTEAGATFATVFSVGRDQLLKKWYVSKGSGIYRLQCHATAIAFSPDGNLLIAPGRDGVVRICDVATGMVLNELSKHSDVASDAAFSANGQMAISGGWDGRIKLWDVPTSRLLRSINAHSAAIWSVSFSPDGKLATSASSDQSLKIWRVADGTLVATLSGHKGAVTWGDFSPQGNHVLSASQDKTLRLWDWQSGKCLWTFQGHEKPVWRAAWAGDGKSFLSASWDGTVRNWDVASGRLIATVNRNDDPLWDVAICKEDQLALIAGSEPSVKLIDIALGTVRHTFRDDITERWRCAVSPDNQIVASLSANGIVWLRDLSYHQRAKQLQDVVLAPTTRPQVAIDASQELRRGMWFYNQNDPRQAIECLTRAASGGAKVPALLLARCHLLLRELDIARTEFRAAMTNREAAAPYLQLCIAAPFPTIPAVDLDQIPPDEARSEIADWLRTREETGMSVANRASRFLRIGKHLDEDNGSGLSVFKRGIKLFEDAGGAETKDAQNTWWSLLEAAGNAQLKLGPENRQAAVDYYLQARERALEMQKRWPGPDSLNLIATSENDLAAQYFAQEDWSEAVESYRASLQYLTEAKAPLDERIARMNSIADVLQRQGESNDAMTQAVEALKLANEAAKRPPANSSSRDLLMQQCKTVRKLLKSSGYADAGTAGTTASAAVAMIIDSLQTVGATADLHRPDYQLLMFCIEFARDLADSEPPQFRLAAQVHGEMVEMSHRAEYPAEIIADIEAMTAWTYCLANDPPKALEYAKQAQALNVADASVDLNSGHAYLLNGQPDQAKRLYIKSLSKQPDEIETIKADFQKLRDQDLLPESGDAILVQLQHLAAAIAATQATSQPAAPTTQEDKVDDIPLSIEPRDSTIAQ